MTQKLLDFNTAYRTLNHWLRDHTNWDAGKRITAMHTFNDRWGDAGVRAIGTAALNNDPKEDILSDLKLIPDGETQLICKKYDDVIETVA